MLLRFLDLWIVVLLKLEKIWLFLKMFFWSFFVTYTLELQLYIQLTLEQHGFELCGSTYMCIFSIYAVTPLSPPIYGFYIHRFNQPWMENSIFAFPTVIPNYRLKILFWICGWLNLRMLRAECRVTSLYVDFQLCRGWSPWPSCCSRVSCILN